MTPTGPTSPPTAALAAAGAPRRKAEQFYFVLPDRFANGDTGNDRGGLTGDRLSTGYDPTDKGFYHGGDLKGLIDKLDYIQGLGTTAIWLAPVFKNRPVQGSGADASAGYHGYWITDFTQVDPHFGTNDDLKRLVDAAHQRGMKIFLDVIANHTADVIDYAENQYAYLRQGDLAVHRRAGAARSRTATTPTARRAFPTVDSDSFPYTPVVRRRRDANVKVPAWLNDPTMYHNRGDSTFAGENSEYGDFFGLDDLWTERPEVVRGHDEDLRGLGRRHRRRRLPASTPSSTSTWTSGRSSARASTRTRRAGRQAGLLHVRRGLLAPTRTITSTLRAAGRPAGHARLPASRRRPRGYAAGGGAARALADLYAARRPLHRARTPTPTELPTFLGNHDMGRIGTFLAGGGTDAGQPAAAGPARPRADVPHPRPAGRLLRRRAGLHRRRRRQGRPAGHVRLQDRRLPRRRPARHRPHPRRRQLRHRRTRSTATIAELGRLRKAHPALRDGVQIDPVRRRRARRLRRSPGSTRPTGTEYVVAVNNADDRADGHRATPGRPAPRSTGSTAARRDADDRRRRQAHRHRAAAVGASCSRPAGRSPQPAAEPTSRSPRRPPARRSPPGPRSPPRSPATRSPRSPSPPRSATGRGSCSAPPTSAPVHGPPRPDRPGRPARRSTYKAVVRDGAAGRRRPDAGHRVVGTPAAGRAPRDYAVVHYQRADGDYDDWGLYTWGDIDPAYGTAWPHGPAVRRARTPTAPSPGSSSSRARRNVGFLVVDTDGNKDVAADRIVDLTPDRRDLAQAGRRDGLPVPRRRPPASRPAGDEGTAVLHYRRADGNYDGWGLHLWDGAANPTDWSSRCQPTGIDAYGAVFRSAAGRRAPPG